ncbi:MAG: hypothetical protein CVV47_06840 [Spirochaetae bacterium HGW-Spirochaetae-3]|jgi:hypothetical protein|nr:MAG: hypothetical protein CVV47_06840 [Spirochaetae bacterium HGW-Spirochaetae-3]
MRNDTLFINARIYGLEKEGEHFGAMRVAPDGRVAELYPEGAPPPPDLETVDMGGKTIVPAFIDAHAHFMSKAALAATAVNLSRFEDGRIIPDRLDGVRELLSAKAKATRGLVMGFGACIGALAERRLPTASELDAWLPGRLVIILSMDGHSSSYSSVAIARLGIADLAVDGLLCGEAHEFNMGKVISYAMRGLGPAALARGLSTAVREAVDYGVVSVHCLEGTEDTPSDPAVAAFSLIGGRLGLRLRLWMQYTELPRAERYAGRLERRRVGGCMAWEMDGSVSSRSAAFDVDYLDRPNSGSLYRSTEEAIALVRPFYEAGWQTSAHAIGPRGIESILSAYERLMDGAGDDANRQRLRIDHFEFPRPDQIARAGARRMVLPVQPGFAWMDERYVHMYEEALAPGVIAAQCPLRSLLDAGCVVALSTDAPVQPLDPFLQIAGAVEHPVPSERISVYEALRAYSWAGAYAAFEDGERGTLAPGKYADFALLDEDPFTVPTERLSNVRVVGTWHEGKRLTAPPPGLAGFAARAIVNKRRPL